MKHLLLIFIIFFVIVTFVVLAYRGNNEVVLNDLDSHNALNILSSFDIAINMKDNILAFRFLQEIEDEIGTQLNNRLYFFNSEKNFELIKMFENSFNPFEFIGGKIIGEDLVLSSSRALISRRDISFTDVNYIEFDIDMNRSITDEYINKDILDELILDDIFIQDETLFSLYGELNDSQDTLVYTLEQIDLNSNIRETSSISVQIEDSNLPIEESLNTPIESRLVIQKGNPTLFIIRRMDEKLILERFLFSSESSPETIYLFDEGVYEYDKFFILDNAIFFTLEDGGVIALLEEDSEYIVRNITPSGTSLFGYYIQKKNDSIFISSPLENAIYVYKIKNNKIDFDYKINTKFMLFGAAFVVDDMFLISTAFDINSNKPYLIYCEYKKSRYGSCNRI